MNIQVIFPPINLNDVDWAFFSMMVEARRHYLGLSKLDIAALLGVDLKDVAQAATGKKLNAVAYLKFCDWYGVRFEWFYKAEILAKRQVL